MSVPLKSRVLVADDHGIVRRGVRDVLDAQPDFEVVAEAADGHEAVERVLAGGVDLVVLDVTMPRLTGLQAARQISERQPDVKILMLSMHDNERYFFEAVRAGASGYVLKSVADRDLVGACRATMRGEPFVYPQAVRTLIRDYVERADGDAADGDPLSPRESEVVTLVAEGHSTREIAELLAISERTVEGHRANVLEKLGLHDRVELTKYAIRRRLIEA